MEAALGGVFGAGWAAGVNLYATVFLLGLAGRLGWADTPEQLQAIPVLVGAAALYLVEFVIDKTPLADSGWDVVHTFVRPVGAAVLGALLAGETDLNQLFAAGASAATALGSHLTKAGIRVAVNASPEPASNILVSLLEDGLVAAVVFFVVENPLVAGAIALVLLVAGLLTLILLWKAVRAGWRRWRDRRRGIVTQPGGHTHTVTAPPRQG